MKSYGKQDFVQKTPNLLDVIGMVYKRRTFVLLFTVGIAILTAILSVVMLSDYYKSSATFYAASPDLAMPEKVLSADRNPIEFYGGKEDVDRLLAVGSSNGLFQHLIETFDLYAHYEIDAEKKLAPLKVKTQLQSLYEISKNKRGGIELAIEDKSPEMSTAMVDTAVTYINRQSLELIRSNQRRQIEGYTATLTSQASLLNSLQDSLQELRRTYTIYNLTSQGEMLSEQLGSQENKLVEINAKIDYLSEGPSTKRTRDSLAAYQMTQVAAQKSYDRIKERIDSFNLGFEKVFAITRQVENGTKTITDLSEMKNLLQSAQKDEVNALHMIERAEVPIYKSRPKRSLIVMAATFLAFVFALLAVIVYETYKHLRWSQIIRES